MPSLKKDLHMLTFSRCTKELSAGLFTWILDQMLNEILSLLPHGQRPPTVSLILRVEVNYRDPLAQSLNSTDVETEAQSHSFYLATHCLSTVLSPSQRVCAGNADPHLHRPRHTPSPPPRESRAEEQR